MPSLAVLALFGGMLIAVVVAGAYYTLGRMPQAKKKLSLVRVS